MIHVDEEEMMKKLIWGLEIASALMAERCVNK
jgi:hypothetical protein